MIQNQRQYNVTKGQVSKLESALRVSREAKAEMDPRIYAAMISGIESQIAELHRELSAYDELKEATSFQLRSAEELGEVLIKARVARGYTQKDLADAIKVKPQQIQRYEATGYRSASLKRIGEVIEALRLDLQAEIPLKEDRVAVENR